VYLPALTPSNFSSSAWSTHCRLSVSEPCCWSKYPISGSKQTYLAGDVQLNGLDTDVLGPLRHDVCLLWGSVLRGGEERRGRVQVLFLVQMRCARGSENNATGRVGFGYQRRAKFRRVVVDARGEFEMEMEMEMVMKTGEGEGEEEKDGIGIIIQHQALATRGDFGSSRCASVNGATFVKMVRCSSFAATAPTSVPCQLVPR
jgi:hypothetical protein